MENSSLYSLCAFARAWQSEKCPCQVLFYERWNTGNADLNSNMALDSYLQHAFMMNLGEYCINECSLSTTGISDVPQMERSWWDQLEMHIFLIH